MKYRRTDPAQGLTLVASASLLYATYGIWTKLIGSQFGAFQQAVIRGFIVSILMFALAYFLRQLTRIDLQDYQTRKWLIVLFVANALIQAPMYYAILHTGMGLSMAVGYVSVVIAAYLLGRLVNQERLTKAKLISLSLGVSGTFAVFAASGAADSLGLALAVVSGVATAFDILALQKLRFEALQAAGLSWLAVVLTNIPLAILFNEPQIKFSASLPWAYLTIFAITSLVASWVHTTGLRKVDAGAVGLFGLLEIVFAMAFGIMLFHERLSLFRFIGLMLILFACALPYIRRHNTAKIIPTT